MTTDKVLEILTNSNGVVSGKQIGDCLSISRVAVNKHINKLKEQGINITSTKKGYILIETDILSQVTLAKKLNANDINLTVYIKEVNSTNTEAKQIVTADDGDFLVVAPIQRSGKGRNQREFVSEIGGAYMTLSYTPKQLQVMDSLKIVLLTGLAVARVLSTLLKGVEIKWPNDVFVNGKKICGILLESTLSDTTVSKLFLGIGINVNNDLPIELNGIATSLKAEGVNTDREFIIVEVMRELIGMLTEFETIGFSKFEKEYIAKCRSIGKDVSVATPNGIINGKGIGLSPTGYLLVENQNGINEIIVGDVGL